ncbi:MAG: serine/threonine protein kinase [Akkermansiaceae bacterium]|nr:serine/threonine protein kinase [Akkermansiaceae bacterium]
MSDSPVNLGFQAPEPEDLAPLFPGYEIEGLIASGGMGAVYCATQKSLDRTVALKILPSELSSDASFRSGFEAEAKAMARLNHPNLIGVYDFGEAGGMLYIIMEYVPGKSVYHSAYGIAIDQAEVIRLMTGICHGLAHAHENGIIHRDIKPANVLLDLNAQPKIGDFGLARPADRKFEEGEGIFGTPHYTAPEVVDHPHAVDYRADIFSVGVMLHELLTSRLPADDPRPASAIIHCDPRFDRIIHRATDPDPKSRYASANDLAQDLQVIGSSLGQSKIAPAAGMPRHRRALVPKRTKKSSTSPFLAAVVVLVLVAGGLYWFSAPPRSVKKQDETTIVVIPSNAKTENPETTNQDNVAPPNPEKEPTTPPQSDEVVLNNETPDGQMTQGTEQPEKEVEETPQEPTLPAAKFDVPDFLERAKKIMQDKARSSIITARANLKTNLEAFERDLKRSVRKQRVQISDEESLQKELTQQIESWAENGYKIPESFSGSLLEISAIDEVAAKYIQTQTGIVDTRDQQISSLSPTYILGLEKQIERLKPDNDVGAIALIEAEVKLTREDAKHFNNLMLEESSSQE